MTTPGSSGPLHGGHVRTAWLNASVDGGCIAVVNGDIIFTIRDQVGDNVLLDPAQVLRDWPDRAPTDEEAEVYAATVNDALPEYVKQRVNGPLSGNR